MPEMLKIRLDAVQTIYSHATCGGMTMRLFYVACVCLFLFSAKDKRIKNWIIIPTFLFLVFFLLNPILLGSMVYKNLQDPVVMLNNAVANYGWLNWVKTYARFYYILPVELVLAYSFVRLMEPLKGIVKKGLFFALIVLVLNTYGDFGYNNGYCVKADNLYDVPRACVELADSIRNEWDDGNKKVVAPEEIAMYIRQYDPSIELAFGRASRGVGDDYLRRLMIGPDEYDYIQIAERALTWNADFFIEDTSWQTIGELPAENFIPVARVRKDDTAEYVLYRVVQS